MIIHRYEKERAKKKIEPNLIKKVELNAEFSKLDSGDVPQNKRTVNKFSF